MQTRTSRISAPCFWINRPNLALNVFSCADVTSCIDCAWCINLIRLYAKPIKLKSRCRAPPVVDQGESCAFDVGLYNFFADFMPRSSFVGAERNTVDFAPLRPYSQHEGVYRQQDAYARQLLVLAAVPPPRINATVADTDTDRIAAPSAVNRKSRAFARARGNRNY